MSSQKYTINDFAMMTPMKYYNNETESQKRSDMINNKNDEYMATVKNDGDWSMLIHYTKGNNLIRSRSISKVTGVYGDYTDKLPHICEEMDKLPDNTILLAELCWDEPGTNANTVGTILRCLPAKAVERQKEHKLKALVFDCLMINGNDNCFRPYSIRFADAHTLMQTYLATSAYIYTTQECKIDEQHTNFLEWADEIITNGGEGLVIQRKDNPYMPGTRTAWKTLKLKQSLPEMELKVIGTIAPKKQYEGDCIGTWPYWEVFSGHNNEDPDTGELTPIYDLVEVGPEVDRKTIPGNPVTKPFFYGWKNGVTVEYNGTTCDVTSGLTDADREWLATFEAKQMIANGELYAVVKAMQTNDLGKLRHGYVVRLRNDL